jgi:hypothetical protein
MTKYFVLCWGFSEEPRNTSDKIVPAKSAGDYALVVLESMGYRIKEVRAPEDPKQTIMEFAQ